MTAPDPAGLREAPNIPLAERMEAFANAHRDGSDYDRAVAAVIDIWTAEVRALATPAPLDAAWAEAEAALPEGWACMVSGEGEPPKPKYLARAGRIKFHWPPEVIWADGDTPAAALRALAARLREREA